MDKLSVSQLREFATAQGITVSYYGNKDVIIKRIKKALACQKPPPASRKESAQK